MAVGAVPAAMGGPAVLVAVAIGVTVLDPVFITYAVTGLAGPGEVIDAASGAACAGAYGPTAAEPSATTSEISTAATTRQRGSARRPVVTPARMANRPLVPTR